MVTPTTPFRLGDEVLEQLDWLTEHMAEGVQLTRTQVIKSLIAQEYQKRTKEKRGPGRPRKDAQEGR